MRYTTKEQVEKYVGETITANIDLYIKASSDFIENYTGRKFYKSDEEVRYYDGNNKTELVIDPAISIVSVEMSSDERATYEDVEYIIIPYNELPIMRLAIVNNRFISSRKSIKVTGRFGYSECPPDDIKLMATILSASMYKGKSSAEIASEKIGDYSVSFENEEGITDLSNIKKMLNKYKKL